MFDFRKILKAQGIDLDVLQAEAAKVPALLEVLVKASNAQTRAIKEQTEKIDHVIHYLQAKGMK